MGFANIDNHRQIRTGFPEVVYCEGKTPEQIRDIFYELARHGSVMGTRADERDYEAVSRVLPDAVYHREARIIEYGARTVRNSLVAVVSAGTADMPVAQEAAVTAEILGSRVDRIFDVGVAGLHRLLDKIDRITPADVVIVRRVWRGLWQALWEVLSAHLSLLYPQAWDTDQTFRGCRRCFPCLTAVPTALLW